MFVLKKTYNKLLEEIETTESENLQLTMTIESLKNENTKLEESLEELTKEVEKLQNSIEVLTREENSVTIKIDDNNINKAEPIVKFKRDISDKLVEAGFLKIDMGEDDYAIQLALMQIAREVLEQILESFEEEIRDV